MTGVRSPSRASRFAAALIVAGALVLACPVHSQITSGSVTVLPDAEPMRRPGPGSGESASPPPPPAEPRLLTTTPVGGAEASDALVEGPTTAREAPRSGVSSEFVGTTRVSPPPAMEAAPPADADPGAASRAGSDARTPRQPSRLQAETEIGDEARPSPVNTRDVQPRSESGVVVTEQRFSEPRLEPEPEPVREPAPTFVTPAPQPPAPPAPPAGETPPAVEPDLPAEPERALTEAPRVRFDDLPAEGAEIQAYDELLAAGVDAAADARPLDELTSLQLREWLAQMREAVQDHPSVRVARLQAEASEAGVDQARSLRMPQITLSSELGNERRVRDGEETASGVTGRDRDLELSPTIDADLLLFDGGAAQAGIDAAEQRVEAGNERTQAATDTIALRAAQTLIDLATLRAQITLAEENLNEVRRLRAMIQERSEAGRDSPSDMFRMDSRVREAENTLEQRVAAFNAARANYAEVFRSDPIVLGLPPAYAPVPPSASAAIDRAVQRNAELLEARAIAEASALDADARRAERWPQVSLGASVTGFDITREGEEYYNSFLGLRVNAPLFDGGSRQARIDQAQRQARLERARVDQLRANVVRSVSEAYSARASLRPRLEALRAQVESNRSTLEAYEEQFFTGRRPLNDLVTAQRELYAAQADLLDLRGELHLQHFTIRRLTGDVLSEYGLPAGND